MRGFTLIELMISLAIMGVITAAATLMLSEQGRVYQVVDDVTEVQQSVRAVSDLLTRELRATGFMVAEGAAFCGRDNVNTADFLYVTDSNSVDPGGAVVGAGIASGYTGNASDTLIVSNVVVDGVAFYDTDADSVADSDFQVGAGVIIADSSDPSRGASCGEVTRVAPPNTLVVSYTNGGTPIPVAGTLVAVPAHVYTVAATGQLTRDGVTLTSGVDDLQFALFYDLDGDGIVDANAEDPGSAAFIGTYSSANWDNSLLREVRVNLVARSRAADPNFTEGYFQQTENRTAIAGKDGFRRRVFTASVRPRNVGQRGGM